MMKRVVAIYTGKGLAQAFEKAFVERYPDIRLDNIIDDSLIRDVVEAGEVTAQVSRRLIQYYLIAENMGADVIINTCSSVGEVADAAKGFLGIPIVKIDQAMAEEAVQSSESIGVLATLSTTLNPTIRLLESEAARAGKNIQIVDGLASGAYEALIRGEPERHDQLLLDKVCELAKDVDTIVLAQGSMARMEQALREKTGKSVLASPPLCIKSLESFLKS